MSITFDDDKNVTIVGDIYSIEDIYIEAKNQNRLDCLDNFENTYVFYNNLIIGNKEDITKLHAINCEIIIKGELLQVYKNSELMLGLKRSNLSTYNGCKLIGKNLKFAYGFGSTDKDNSGSLKAYSTTFEMNCYWGFFGTDSNSELINCQVNAGYGRFSGENTYIDNILFSTANGRYGTFSIKGKVKKFANISNGDITPYTHKDDDTVYKSAIYYNPYYSGSMTIPGGILKNYEKVIYCESGEGELILEDITFDENIPIERYIKEDNKCTIKVQNSYSGICLDKNNNPLEAHFEILDKDDNVLIDEDTKNGKFDFKLLRGTMNEEETELQEVFPLLIKISYTIEDNDYMKFFKFDRKVPMVNHLCHLDEIGADVPEDNDSCATNDKIDKSVKELSDKLDNIENGIKQVLGNVVTEINENQSIIEELGIIITI